MENALRDKMQEFGRMQSNYRLIASHNKVSVLPLNFRSTDCLCTREWRTGEGASWEVMG